MRIWAEPVQWRLPSADYVSSCNASCLDIEAFQQCKLGKKIVGAVVECVADPLQESAQLERCLVPLKQL